jgi:hypothetical protein
VKNPNISFLLATKWVLPMADLTVALKVDLTAAPMAEQRVP